MDIKSFQVKGKCLIYCFSRFCQIESTLSLKKVYPWWWLLFLSNFAPFRLPKFLSAPPAVPFALIAPFARWWSGENRNNDLSWDVTLEGKIVTIENRLHSIWAIFSQLKRFGVFGQKFSFKRFSIRRFLRYKHFRYRHIIRNRIVE